MGEQESLVVTRFGAGATSALARMVARVQSDDPLAPVDVIAPSAVSGMTLRRAIAGPAMANVRFGSLPQLAERLAMRRLAIAGLRPLSDSTRGLAMKRAIQSSDGDLAKAAAHPATADMVESVIAELDEAEAHVGDWLDRLATRGARAKELAHIHRAFRVAKGQLLTPPDVYDVATAAVASEQAPLTTVILFAPHRLSPGERRLLTALAEHDQLLCVLPRVGEAEVDAGEEELAHWLAGLLGAPASDDDVAQQEVTLAWEPDAEEEVRQAVRRVLAHIAVPRVRPERIAIAYRSATPYARLLDEQLSVAGLPFHVTGARRLADSVTGRTLLRLLDLRSHDYPRSEVIAWLGDAPVRRADGKPVPVATWDRLSRDAGANRTHQTWRDRLDRHAADIARRRDKLSTEPTSVTPDADDEARRAHYDRRLQECDDLASFVDDLVAHCNAVAAATTWTEVAEALRAGLTRFLGGTKEADRWAAETATARWRRVERGAYDAVLAAVAELALLDEVAAGPATYDSVRQTLSRQLDRALPSGTTLGRGITVGQIRDMAGTDLDLLIVLGMTEDAFPPRIRENPVLRDDERTAVPGLLTAHDQRRAERRSYLAATASARQVVLSAPRADTRAQRGLHPSPWFMEKLTDLNNGIPIPSDELGRLSEPLLSRHDSFEHALRTTSSPASEAEFDLALAVTGHGDVLADIDGRYARSRQSICARRDGVFAEWTGHIGDLGSELCGEVDEHLSASSLQTYATCPLRFWLGQVLGVHDLEDPGDEDTIEAATKGTLVHRVLEQFMREALPSDGPPTTANRPPSEPWTTGEIARAHAMLDDAAAELEAAGLTGRPLLWKAQKSALHRQLTRILGLDSRLRATRRTTPIAVEAPFGREGRPPLVLSLERSGEVRLAGYIDRVDRTADGALVVTDYKTGRGSSYERIPQVGKKEPKDLDLVDRGRKLQVVMYGLAARQTFGDSDTPVESYYWFVEQDGMHRGAPIDSAAERRLLDVLDVSVHGIRSGVYPAHPGEEGYFGWENCGFCPFHRVCPTNRGEQWETLRMAPPVRPYAGVADPLPGMQTDGEPETNEGGSQ